MSAEYTLGEKEHVSRYEGDPLAHDIWEVYRDGVLVARISDLAYPGRFAVSVNPVRWAGPQSRDYFDARFHDGGPFASLDEAMAFARRQTENFIQFRMELQEV